MQNKTRIPIPRIIDWSDDASNAIGSEYIIMEHASGVCLASKWHEMTEVQRTLCMKPIYQKMKEAANLAFPAYGSIYRTDTPYIKGSTIPLDSDFCIGPSCDDLYWNCSPASPKYYHDIKPNRGPCKPTPIIPVPAQNPHHHPRAIPTHLQPVSYTHLTLPTT